MIGRANRTQGDQEGHVYVRQDNVFLKETGIGFIETKDKSEEDNFGHKVIAALIALLKKKELSLPHNRACMKAFANNGWRMNNEQFPTVIRNKEIQTKF